MSNEDIMEVLADDQMKYGKPIREIGVEIDGLAIEGEAWHSCLPILSAADRAEFWKIYYANWFSLSLEKRYQLTH